MIYSLHHIIDNDLLGLCFYLIGIPDLCREQFPPFCHEYANLPFHYVEFSLKYINRIFYSNLVLQVKCMELKRPDHIVAPNKRSIINDDGSIKNSSAGLCSSVEIKDAYLPPWIICSLCAIMGSEGKSFEAR